MNEQDFKDAMSAWASGVSVVACRGADGNAYGLTVSSFSSLSMDPPLALVCLNTSNRLPHLIRETGTFAISILAEGQDAVSNHFASRGREPSPELGVPSEALANGQPAVAGAAAQLACTVHAMIEQGTHLIVVGRLTEARSAGDAAPLVYFKRAYRTVTGL